MRHRQPGDPSKAQRKWAKKLSIKEGGYQAAGGRCGKHEWRKPGSGK